MTVIDSDINPNSEAKRQRETEEAYRERATQRGKLLPRERLSRLLDPGSPFVEIGSIAGYNMVGDKDGATAGGNLIAGVGYVSGRRCLVIVWIRSLS